MSRAGTYKDFEIGRRPTGGQVLRRSPCSVFVPNQAEHSESKLSSSSFVSTLFFVAVCHLLHTTFHDVLRPHMLSCTYNRYCHVCGNNNYSNAGVVHMHSASQSRLFFPIFPPLFTSYNRH